MTVQVTPQKVRYLVNGHLFYEDDDPSPTSPWLGLFTYRERHSVWRELHVQGRAVDPARGQALLMAIASKAGSPASTARPSPPAAPSRKPTSMAMS